MARPSKSRALGIWMNGIRVGRWRVNARRAHEFNYESSWLGGADARPISLSLPLAPPDFTCSGRIVESLSSFDLRAEVGRDCVGAIQLLRDSEEPTGTKRIEAREVDPAGIEAILEGVASATGLGTQPVDNSFRISIAGAQEKTALLNHEGRWKVPLGSTPTTQILKLPLGRMGGIGIDMSGSVENEWLCSRIAQSPGMRTDGCEISRFGDTTVLVVERFDRRIAPDGSWIMRLLLGSQEAASDREAFLMAQVFFWLMAAPDGHAKNFSVFIERGGRFRRTPLYDIMSAYPVMGHGSGLMPPEKLPVVAAWVNPSMRCWEG